MPDTYRSILILTAVLLGLIAGLFYAYSCSVNPGLWRLADHEYLRAMQSINNAIQNPLFLLSFAGALLLLPLSTWLTYRHSPGSAIFYLALAATIIYLVGAIGVTIAGNIPLNEALDKIDLSNASVERLRQVRIDFEQPWNRLHTIRAFSTVVSFALFLLATIRK